MAVEPKGIIYCSLMTQLLPRGRTPYDGLYREAPPQSGTFCPFLGFRYMEGQGFH